MGARCRSVAVAGTGSDDRGMKEGVEASSRCKEEGQKLTGVGELWRLPRWHEIGENQNSSHLAGVGDGEWSEGLRGGLGWLL